MISLNCGSSSLLLALCLFSARHLCLDEWEGGEGTKSRIRGILLGRWAELRLWQLSLWRAAGNAPDGCLMLILDQLHSSKMYTIPTMRETEEQIPDQSGSVFCQHCTVNSVLHTVSASAKCVSSLYTHLICICLSAPVTAKRLLP